MNILKNSLFFFAFFLGQFIIMVFLLNFFTGSSVKTFLLEVDQTEQVGRAITLLNNNNLQHRVLDKNYVLPIVADAFNPEDLNDVKGFLQIWATEQQVDNLKNDLAKYAIAFSLISANSKEPENNLVQKFFWFVILLGSIFLGLFGISFILDENMRKFAKQVEIFSFFGASYEFMVSSAYKGENNKSLWEVFLGSGAILLVFASFVLYNYGFSIFKWQLLFSLMLFTLFLYFFQRRIKFLVKSVCKESFYD